MSTGLDLHGQWTRAAFDSLCGSEHDLSASRIRSRAFTGWMRAFISDMVMQGQLSPMKVVPTARIIHILTAKVKSHKRGRLTAEEFDSCTRAIVHPSLESSFEASFVWSLFDTSRAGQISRQTFAQLADLWSDLGLEYVTSEIAELDIVTVDQYHAWIRSCQPDGNTVALPPRAATAPSGERRLAPPSRMMSARPSMPQDHVLRSSEVATTSFLDVTPRVGLARTLTPSWCSKVKRPRGKQDDSEMSPNLEDAKSLPATPRLPNVKRIDWKSQQELWSRRDHRLIPYMRVKTEYRKPDGSKGEAFGTLLTGWGVPNKATRIPHSVAPEGARLGDARRARERDLQDLLSDRGDPSVQQLSEPWSEEVARWRDIEHHVVVRIDGIERLVPRENVTPTSSSHFHAFHHSHPS